MRAGVRVCVREIEIDRDRERERERERERKREIEIERERERERLLANAAKIADMMETATTLYQRYVI